MSSHMATRRALATRVETELSRNEQETSIQFFGDANTFQIVTYAPPMVRQLLLHAESEIEWCYVARGDGRGGRVSNLSELTGDDAPSGIGGVCARLPVGALTVKGRPRKDNRISRIVNTPDDARAADAAFEA